MPSQLLYRSNKSQLYLDSSESDTPILSKRLVTEDPSPKEVQQFYNEYQILKDIELDGVRKVYEKRLINSQHSISLEYIDGVTLEQYLKTKPSLEDILKIFIQIVHIIQGVHEQSIIHRDISDTNILIKPETLDVFIIDFEIASKINLRIKNLGNPERLKGSLRYMAPEQTGRVNRSIDQRTDIYSIGVLMYQALTNQVPFDYTDPLELIHAHLAIVPEAVSHKNPQVPSVLADIVARLLEKDADKRYQSALGLKYDLEQCLQHLKQGGAFDFSIGEQDYKSSFRISPKLYGREKETQLLLEKFEYVNEGHKSIMLVSGISGTGKSALVAELYKPITEKAAYFIDGKFDQYQAAVPYSAVLKAMNKYIELLLTEDNIKLNSFNEIILRAVGDEGKVLTNVLPQLELIIGKQPEIPELNLISLLLQTL